MFETDEKHLTSDRESHLIHIRNQDGCFLRYIDNICVISKDNLIVAELNRNKVKIIQH